MGIRKKKANRRMGDKIVLSDDWDSKDKVEVKSGAFWCRCELRCHMSFD